MTRVVVNGIELHTQRLSPRIGTAATAGRGPDSGPDAEHEPHLPRVVFIHGIGADSLASFYFTVAHPLCAGGVEVIAYDLRGHGRSTQPASGYRLSDFTADLSGLLDALRVPGPVHLVGNSFGGTLAFSYAVEHPGQVASVVMIEAELATQEWANRMASALDIAINPGNHAADMALITERYGAYLAWFDKAADRIVRTTMARDIPSGPVLSRQHIQSVRIPVLVILGGESDLVDRAALAELLPDCRIAVVPGQDHSVLVKAPEAVRDLLLAWIGEHHPAPLSPPAPAPPAPDPAGSHRSSW